MAVRSAGRRRPDRSPTPTARRSTTCSRRTRKRRSSSRPRAKMRRCGRPASAAAMAVTAAMVAATAARSQRWRRRSTQRRQRRRWQWRCNRQRSRRQHASSRRNGGGDQQGGGARRRQAVVARQSRDAGDQRTDSRHLHELNLDARTAGACARRAQGGNAGQAGAGGCSVRRRAAAGRLAHAFARDGRTSAAHSVRASSSSRDSTKTIFHPRIVMLGQGNLDYTEVVSGLKEGERVVMLGALALQAQRQQQQDRLVRTPSPLGGQSAGRPGGPGGPGGGGGGGGGGRGG